MGGACYGTDRNARHENVLSRRKRQVEVDRGFYQADMPNRQADVRWPVTQLSPALISPRGALPGRTCLLFFCPTSQRSKAHLSLGVDKSQLSSAPTLLPAFKAHDLNLVLAFRLPLLVVRSALHHPPSLPSSLAVRLLIDIVATIWLAKHYGNPSSL